MVGGIQAEEEQRDDAHHYLRIHVVRLSLIGRNLVLALALTASAQVGCGAGARTAEFSSAVLPVSPAAERSIQAGTDTVAVMPFANATSDTDLDWLCTGISETITGDLLTLGGFVVVERLQLWRVMEEQELHVTGAVDDESVMEIGKLLGADYLIVGAFQKMGGTLRLTARFVEAESGSIMQSAKVTGRLDDVFDLQDQIVSELAASLKMDQERTKAAISEVDPTGSVDAFRHFGTAMLLESQQDYPGAVAELQAALEIDPGFDMAREQLARVWWPLREGNSWVYETGSIFDGSLTVLLRTTRHATGPIEYEGRACVGLVSESALATADYWVLGEEGVAHLGRASKGEDPSGQLYSPALLLFPLDLEIGLEWETLSSTWLVEEERGAGQAPVHYEVVGTEQFEIADNTLTCYVILTQPLIPGTRVSQTYWFAPGVGLVKWYLGDSTKRMPDQGALMVHTLKGFSFSSRITWR